MKKIRLFLLALALLFILPMETNASSTMMTRNDIPLIPKPKTGEDGHRIPAVVPISCYYSEGELTFTFSANLGTVECEVVRVTDHEVFEATFYTVSGGSDSLYVSTDADDYEITLTCADGTIYYGEYSIE